jgi:hypothetical protein
MFTESSRAGDISFTRGLCCAMVAVIVSPNTDSGVWRWFASMLRIWFFQARNAAESARGCVIRNHTSWKSVSRSFDDADPRSISPVSPSCPPTPARLPVSAFPSVIALKVPRPLTDTRASLRSASMTAESGSSDSPPGLCAPKSTSSALKSVGLSNTRAPFDSVHSTMSVPSSVRSLRTLPAGGRLATRGAFDVEST